MNFSPVHLICDWIVPIKGRSEPNQNHHGLYSINFPHLYVICLGPLLIQIRCRDPCVQQLNTYWTTNPAAFHLNPQMMDIIFADRTSLVAEQCTLYSTVRISIYTWVNVWVLCTQQKPKRMNSVCTSHNVRFTVHWKCDDKRLIARDWMAAKKLLLLLL